MARTLGPGGLRLKRGIWTLDLSPTGGDQGVRPFREPGNFPLEGANPGQGVYLETGRKGWPRALGPEGPLAAARFPLDQGRPPGRSGPRGPSLVSRGPEPDPQLPGSKTGRRRKPRSRAASLEHGLYKLQGGTVNCGGIGVQMGIPTLPWWNTRLGSNLWLAARGLLKP